MSIITIFIFIVAIYLLIGFFFILRQEIKVKVARENMFKFCSDRFSIFEDLISKLKNKKDYELTFLNEVVNCRINIQKNKKQKNFKLIFPLEEKTTKISDNIIILLKEFPQFDFMKEEEMQELEEKFKEINDQIKDSKKEYNNEIEKFNILKSNPFFVPSLLILGQRNKKYDFWS